MSWVKALCAPLVLSNCLLAPGVHAASKAVGLSGNPAIYYGEDAYPAEAIRLHQQGRVVANLAINPDGKVVSCQVSTSSGSPSLDKQTCDIALEKVVFTPARDKRGRSVAATYVLPVRWILPSGPFDVGANPPPKWTIERTMSIEAGGIVSACNATVTPPSSPGRSPCDEFPVGAQTDYRWVRDGKPVGGTIRSHFSEEITIDP